MKKIALFVAAVAVASQAQAWGDREQGILAGIAGTVIIQHIMESNRERRAPQPDIRPEVQVSPPLVLNRPAPVYTNRPLHCTSRPVLWDQYTGNPIRYETFCQ